MKKLIALSFLITISTGMDSVSQDPIEDFVANYFAALNNLGDAELSLEDRRYFRDDLLATYFTEATIVYNDLRPQGTERIRPQEYLNNVLIDFPKGIVFSYTILDKGPILPADNGLKSTIRLRVSHKVPNQQSSDTELTMVLVISNYSSTRLVARIKSIDLATAAASQPVREEEESRDLPAPIQELERNMVRVQGGTFRMGCTAEQGDDCYDWEKPAHQVTLSSYSIGKYEVTQAQWEAVMSTSIENQAKKGTYNEDLKGVGANYPMYYISWEEAQVFLRKLNEMTGKSYRLPTEAEWEYAARGGNQSGGYKYAGSNSVWTVAWYGGNSSGKTHEVGSKSPNELGLYDMSGNVYEWCSDWYGDYSGDAQRNPQGPDSDAYRVIRGGGWGLYARYCRVSYRFSGSPDRRRINLGFRLAAP